MTPPARAWRSLKKKHGVVLQACARSSAELGRSDSRGGPIRGSWWGHAKGAPDLRGRRARIGERRGAGCGKLVEGKVTYVHRRLWPALVKLAPPLFGKGPSWRRFGNEHTRSGAPSIAPPRPFFRIGCRQTLPREAVRLSLAQAGARVCALLVARPKRTVQNSRL